MPKIIDNQQLKLVEELRVTLSTAIRADFCVGYFNLRGWGQLADLIDDLTGQQVIEQYKDDDVERFRIARLLVGMHKAPDELLKEFFHDPISLSNERVNHLQEKMADEFRRQLSIGYPKAQDEAYLNKLIDQIRSNKLAIKLYLRNTLHAKLYLAHTNQVNAKIVGFVGSSNLTLSGLSAQGELNVDVVEEDAAIKLAVWFDEKWNDRWCLDISDKVADIIEKESWLKQRPPYHIYLKIAYHLSQDARAGLNEFRLPQIFQDQLFAYQQQAVKIAAYHIHKRNGVIIGDVVGLGKTITAAAIARVFQEDFFYKILIICPPNLKSMWAFYEQQYDLHTKILSIGEVQSKLQELKRYKLVIIDESHNLRNKDGKRYKAIREYIRDNDCKVLLLSATPYNKTYSDLVNQLSLFIDPNEPLGIRPEAYIESLGGLTDFSTQHPNILHDSLEAFAQSPFADDWRQLLRRYMVRRTRSFIRNNYAETDPSTQRRYLTFPNGTRSYFPERIPKRADYPFDPNDHQDQYARFYSAEVLDLINELALPRYGLAKYINPKTKSQANSQSATILDNLSRAGERLRGFCRTNLYKRLESSGWAFILSIRRHVLRNYVALWAIQEGKPIPIGTHIANGLEDFWEDQDIDDNPEDNEEEQLGAALKASPFLAMAKLAYALYESDGYKNKFDWVAPEFFIGNLAQDLERDSQNLLKILELASDWKASEDRKFNALFDLLTQKHPNDKILVFTQFADTADYLLKNLISRGLTDTSAVTGETKDPMHEVQRFSPISNQQNLGNIAAPLRVLIATDVLSEGQNLQDAHIIVNYDLPWALIRLIQRAGRVDRIGQKAEQILCYSFLPEDGIENIINLRQRLRERILENAEVVGSDEVFFDGDPVNVHDLYSERSGILDELDNDFEVDLSSYAYQIWKNATDADPELAKIIPRIPQVSYSTKPVSTLDPQRGVVTYARTGRDNDEMVWLDPQAQLVTQNPFRILKAAACNADAPTLERFEHHHDLVKQGLDVIHRDEEAQAGTLGKRTSIKFKLFRRLDDFCKENDQGLFPPSPELKKALDDIYRYPLREYAREVINREFKLIDNEKLAELVLRFWEQGKLVYSDEGSSSGVEPQIICSLGLF
jgi:superfamily II DNA or RNA helicase